MRTTYRPELAEEVAADTLFTVWQKAASFQGNSKVSTWIFGIAYRKSLKALTRTVNHESRAAPDLENMADEAVPPSQDAVMFRNQLGAVLKTLSVEQRTVVILTYVHGYKYEEIAKILGRPTNTIKTRMRAARTRLQAVYGNDAVTEG
jgi:RNA polymerase sigma factor (sigma-70 family)